MKKLTTIWPCALLLCLGLAVPTQAQVGTAKYHFTNRGQVEAAVRANKTNLRASYNIIMCATRQGMVRSAVHAYEQMIDSNPFKVPPELASSFALAHRMMMGGNRWDWKVDNQPGITKLSQADGIKMTLYRDMALQKLPKSPEVLVSYAIWATDQGKRPLALQLVEKALKLAPNWPDLHYWHRVTLENRWFEFPDAQRDKEAPRYGAAMLRALNTAAKLDPWFQHGVDGDKSTAYRMMGRPREALALFDAYTQARPDYVRYWDGRFGAGKIKEMRDELVAQIQKS